MKKIETIEPIKIGVSACLLGQEVRWNGGHARSPYITDTLGRFFTFVPVCPEVEAGFPVPRETFRLVGDPDHPRLLTTKTGVDHTDRMNEWSFNRVMALEAEGLCGFIFKKDSPNSGMERVKVYGEKGVPVKKGVGIFARHFMAHFPRLPVEDEGRLNDPEIRENFIERIFALKRWRESVRNRQTSGVLVEFHTRHKLLIMSHSNQHYREMGRLVAGAQDIPRQQLFERYEALFMEALRIRTTSRKHTNVLQHMLGYFKKYLSGDEKQEILEIIERYRLGFVPLIVPVTLFNHWVRKYRQPYLLEQTYLNPHPVELQLRNHV
jgi:uncharacterized protein YbgA (DUF1722 family)/uncharacterized protein YbbK (DUF523 family)